MTQEFQRRFLEALTPIAERVDEHVFRWKAFEHDTFEYYIRFVGERGCKVHFASWRNQDSLKVSPFLREFTSSQLDAVNETNPIGLFPNLALRDTTFDLGVLAHSSLINGSLTEETDALSERMYTAFPAYRCEFPLADPSYQADLRLQRIIRWADWSRPPAPALRARFSLASGMRSENGDEMHMLRFDELTPVMEDAVAVGGIVEIENFEGIRACLRFAGGQCEIDLENLRRVITGSASLDWLHGFSVDGMNAADMR